MKKLLVLFLALALMLPAMAMAQTDDNTLNGYPLKKGIYEGVTIKLVQPWWTAQDDPEYAESMKSYDQFAAHTGAKIDMITVEQGDDVFTEYKQAILNMVMSNDAPDAVLGTTFPIPGWTSKNLVQPWSKFMDLVDPDASGFSPLIHTGFSIGDDVYGLLSPDTPVWNTMVIYYSKSAFENKGLDDPYELYKAGKWDWDALSSSAQALTYDGGSGAVDHFAIAGWYIIDSYQPFIAANGGDTVKIDESGTPRYALDDPDAIFAINYAVENMPMNAEYLWPIIEAYDWDIGGLLLDGTVAMLHECFWWFDVPVEAMGDDLGIVPFPLGPDYKGDEVSRDYLEACYAWYLMTGSKNPQATADLFGYLYFPSKVYDNPEDAPKGPTNEEYFGDYFDEVMLWTGNAALESARAFPGLETLTGQVYASVTSDGATAANAAESIAQEAQAIIDEIASGN